MGAHDDFFDPEDDAAVGPPPPWDDPDAAVPQAEFPDDSSTRLTAIPVLDERTFVTECCGRLNAFLLKAPKEAQHVLQTFIEYRHELVGLHRNHHVAKRIAEGTLLDDEGPQPVAGAPVAAIFAGLLQTPHGDGFYIRPIFIPDPENPGGHVLLKFEVAGQDAVHPEAERD